MYFITICTSGRVCYFGEIADGEMRMSEIGRYTDACIRKIESLHTDISVPIYQIMPNHVHLLLQFRCRQPKPLSAILQWFKIATTNGYIRGVRQGRYPPYQGHLWQRSFYDHVIRNRSSLAEIRNYIVYNPQKWTQDRFYVEE